MPEQMSDTMSEDIPDRMPGYMSDRMPENMSGTMSADMPSRGHQHICQIGCEKKCLIEYQRYAKQNVRKHGK